MPVVVATLENYGIRFERLAWATVRERQRGREERETTQEVKLANQSALYQKSYLSCSLNYSIRDTRRRDPRLACKSYSIHLEPGLYSIEILWKATEMS